MTDTEAEVYRYVVLVTKNVVPQELWGSERNFKVIRQSTSNLWIARSLLKLLQTSRSS